MGRKCVLQVVFRQVEGKISNEQFCTHLSSVSPDWLITRPFPIIGFQIITEYNSRNDFHAMEVHTNVIDLPKVAGFDGIASPIRHLVVPPDRYVSERK
jgi:hypothetical protein